MIKELINIFKKRKKALRIILNRDNIDDKIKHQLYGAINEINFFLNILEDKRFTEIGKEQETSGFIKDEKDLDKNNFLSKFFGKGNFIEEKDSPKDIKQETY